MQRARTLPRLPKGMTRVTIVTGVEALGRGHDRNRLLNWATTVAKTWGPQAHAAEDDRHTLVERLAIADGIDTDGLLKSEEMKQQEMQAQQQQMAQQAMMPEAASAMGNIAEAAMQEY